VATKSSRVPQDSSIGSLNQAETLGLAPEYAFLSPVARLKVPHNDSSDEKSAIPCLLPLPVLLFVIPQGSAVVLAFGPLSATHKRHLDRSCSQFHRVQRSGEIPVFVFAFAAAYAGTGQASSQSLSSPKITKPRAIPTQTACPMSSIPSAILDTEHKRAPDKSGAFSLKPYPL
jgi:hypothetical protein